MIGSGTGTSATTVSIVSDVGGQGLIVHGCTGAKDSHQVSWEWLSYSLNILFSSENLSVSSEALKNIAIVAAL